MYVIVNINVKDGSMKTVQTIKKNIVPWIKNGHISMSNLQN